MQGGSLTLKKLAERVLEDDGRLPLALLLQHLVPVERLRQLAQKLGVTPKGGFRIDKAPARVLAAKLAEERDKQALDEVLALLVPEVVEPRSIDAEREQAILTTRQPAADINLSRQVVAFVQELRRVDLFKLPGVAESIDWLAALTVLGEPTLNEDIVRRTLGVLLKYQDDIEKIESTELHRLLKAVA